MQTKKLLMLVGIGVVICMLISFTSPSLTIAKPIRLKLATWVSEKPDIGQAMLWWINEAERRTNGRLKIDAYWSQALGTTRETLAMTQKGAVDLGGVPPGYFPKQWPLLQGLADSHHFLGKREELWVVPRALKEVPALEKEIQEDNNVILVNYGQLSEYGLLTKKPVRRLADLKGLRVRTWAEEYPKRWKPYGAVPTTTLMGEAYEGMQKGILDASPMNLPNVVAYGMQEVAKYYLVNAPILCVVGNVLFMNLDTWKKLPPDIQKTILEIKEDSIAQHIKITDTMNYAAKKEMLKAGVEFISLPDSEAQEWLRLVNSIAKTYLTEGMAKLGKGEDGKKLWDVLMRLRREYFEWLKTPEGQKWLAPTPGTEKVFSHDWAAPVALGK